jgi:signal transduction histidine kinase
MSKIIDELLKLSIIRREDVKLIPIDNSKILEDVLKRLDTQIKESRATILKPSHWPIVLGNPQWLEEVWVNLISNAIKYGGSPPVINLGYELETGQSCVFKVEDNGNGLSAASLERIFDDFERLGRKDVEGHGLGLAIVKRILQKLGGQVTVSSSAIQGQGCVFSFTLPTR